MVDAVFELLSDCSKIHWTLDDLKVIWESKFHGIDRTIENPTMLVSLEKLQYVKALCLQLLWRQLQALV